MRVQMALTATQCVQGHHPCLASRLQMHGAYKSGFRSSSSNKLLLNRRAAFPSSQRRLCRSYRSTPCIAASDPSEDRARYRLIEVTLRKPMGLVLVEAKDRKAVVVEEIVEGGNAEQSGLVQVGDILTKCSATVLKAGKGGQYEKEGYGQRPYDNWEKVMFDCEGEDFNTVMAALGSNTERWGIFNVSLVLKRYTTSNAPAAA